MELHEALAARVAGWRADGYPSERFPAIAEILNVDIVWKSDMLGPKILLDEPRESA